MNIQEKLTQYIKGQGFDFMDSWIDQATGTINLNFRKGNKDITIQLISNTDGL